MCYIIFHTAIHKYVTEPAKMDQTLTQTTHHHKDCNILGSVQCIHALLVVNVAY